MNSNRGRGNNRGGRGRGRGYGIRNNDRANKGNNSSSKSNNREVKFSPQTQTKTNYATYATVKEAVIQHIQKSYKGGQDVVKSLKELKKVDLTTVAPTRRVSRVADPDDYSAMQEQHGYDILYQEELRIFLQKKDNLDEGLNKAYALIFTNYCTKAMQQRIEEHPDFKDTIEDDPIALLVAIQTLMHDPVRAQNPMISMTDALTRLLNFRQQEGEDLLDFVKRFKQAKDVTVSQMGKDFLRGFIEHQPEYRDSTNTAEKDAMLKDSFEAWSALLLLRSSDQAKYGTLMKGFISQYSLGNDQYPKTIATAIDVLSNHKIDAKYYENQKNKRDKSRSERSERSERTNDSTNESSFAQYDLTCYCCGKKGHSSTTCDKRATTPREEWHVNRAIQHMQDGDQDAAPTENDNASNNDDNQSVQTTSSNQTTTPSRNRRSGTPSRRNQQHGWSTFQTPFQTELAHNQASKFGHLKDVFILDTGSTISATIMNPDLITNIKPSKTTLAMATNAGTKKMDVEGNIIGYGSAWFDSTQMANIFGFSHMADKYRIQYDNTNGDDTFKVHTETGIVQFKRTNEGLYAYKPTENYLEQVAETKNMTPPTTPGAMQINNMVTTVKENRMGYTERQFKDAKRARQLYHNIGCPTVENFKQLLRQNIIEDCPVTIDDVNIAEKIFGPDVGAMKGKTTRRKPTRVKQDWVEIPPELLQQRNLTLCFDIMYVNGMPMLTAIDREIRFRSLVPLNGRTADDIYEALDKILRHYNAGGFYCTWILSDQEFKTLMDDISDDLGATMNYTSKDEHVPEAERNNRTIGERIRAAYHRLPYRVIPKLMMRTLAMISTSRLNYFPAKGGISPYYSPNMILTQRKLNYEKHCKIPFGAYVQANQENNPTNSNAPRTIDGIYLRPMTNQQGGHEIMNLQTGLKITRNKVWEVPLTDTVIQAVEQMAMDQGMKSLKIEGRNRVAILPADWIAGVDYEGDNQNNNDDDTDEDYEDNDDDYEDDEYDDDEAFDRIDQEEIDELLAEPGQETNNASANPTDTEEAEANEAEDANETEEANDSDDETENETENERPKRATKPIERWTYERDHYQREGKRVKFEDDDQYILEMCHNLIAQVSPNPDEDVEYNPQLAMIIARVMSDINGKATTQGASFGQQYILQKGLKKFKKRGAAAAQKELDQLHRRTCFTPIDISTLTPQEKRKAMEALMLLTEKRDNSVKGRLVYNGKPTREWLSREDAASPTAATESIMLTSIVDAKEERDVMTGDIPNAFIQTKMPDVKDGEERVIMKITGVLVDLLVEMSPEVYGPHVVFENGKKVLYVQVLRALYGMLIASLLWYKQFKSDLEGQGFEFNPYDPCVANRTVNGKQHTVLFHVDDLKSSHVDSKVNDKFLKWLNEMYGGHGEVKATRGKIHDYLGMTFDFSEKGIVKVDMIDYMAAMVDDFSTKFEPDDVAPNPAAEDLLTVGDSEDLEKEQADEFHTLIAKGLWACKRARPDIHEATTALSTRVRNPNQDDWKKLHRLLRYINGTRKDKLILSADNLHVIKWYVDAAFAVHPDFRSHTGGCMADLWMWSTHLYV